jgi:hypothetical protein
MDEYIQRLQGIGLLDWKGDATRELNASALDNLPHDRVTTTVGDAELKAELKKMNKNLKRMLELKKQSNLIALGFYVAILALGFFYLMVNAR